MERKISFKNLYLIGVISLGLIGLGVGSTFAMFTASAEINDSISLTSGLEYSDDVVDLVDMTISSNKVETATLNITNNTSKTLNYTSWYRTNNNNLQIGTVVSNNNSVTGTIAPNGTVQIIVSIRNRGTGVAKVTVGISASEDSIVVSDGVTTLPTDPLPPYLNDYITSLYTSNKDDGTVTNNSIEYKYASSVNLMNDRLGGTTEDLDGGNIRYYGASPSNYIDIGDRTSNDEVILWRILGVFDGKVRIIRDEMLEYGLSWDTSGPKYDVNGALYTASGINEWSQADLMKLLNPGYDNNLGQKCIRSGSNQYDCQDNVLINNSLWWNKQSGTCYCLRDNVTTSCDFTSSGLSNSVKNLLVNQTLYLGGYNETQIYTIEIGDATSNVYADQAYKIERGNNVVQNPSDGIPRTLSWTGKVGLPYPSDWGYATDFNSCTEDLISNSYDNCNENIWITNNGNLSWSISSFYTDILYSAIVINDYGIDDYTIADESSILPTLMLNPKVVLESGTGTSADPFVVD